jgi:hypothetical protein
MNVLPDPAYPMIAPTSLLEGTISANIKYL